MPQKNWPLSTIIHTVVGMAIMLSGAYWPNLSIVVPANDALLAAGFPQVDGGVLVAVTDMGMITLGIFLGVVYLWACVDTLWPCFMGILVLAFSGFAPAPVVLRSFLGNPLVGMIFFAIFFATTLIKSNISSWIARWIMHREFIIGRPWTFTAVLLAGTYLLAFFDQTIAIFVMWPVLYEIFEKTGFKRGDKYVSIMLVYVVIMALCSFASDPFKTGAFNLLANVWNIAATNPEMNAPDMNPAVYLAFAMIISFTSIAALIFMMRFVFRVDVSPLRALSREILQKDPLEPLTDQQKGIIAAFAMFAAWLLLPGFIGKDNPVGAFLTQNMLLAPVASILLVGFLRINGRPIADISETASVYPWRIFFLIAVAMLLGDAMTGKSTNLTVFMEYFLRDLLQGFGYVPLIIACVVLGILLTNFSNSVMLGLVLTPVLLAMCNAFAVDAGPLLACFIYAVLIAACTPAASPFAAILFGNSEWLTPPVIVRYSVISSVLIAGIVIVVGIPLAMLLF